MRDSHPARLSANSPANSPAGTGGMSGGGNRIVMRRIPNEQSNVMPGPCQHPAKKGPQRPDTYNCNFHRMYHRTYDRTY